MRMKEEVTGPKAFAEDEGCALPHNRREYRDFKRFDKALKAAQTGDKELLSRSVNLAAQVAAGLRSPAGIRHVVWRLCLVSKDVDTRKETAVYTTDSILRHVASGADFELLQRYERHLAAHVRNMFKRALRVDGTRKFLAERFLNKILPKWKQKEWFSNEIGSIVEVVHKSAPSLKRPSILSAENLIPKPRPESESDEDESELEQQDAEPLAPQAYGAPPRSPGFLPMSGAMAKAGCPATPMQPGFLAFAPGTPGYGNVRAAYGTNNDVLLRVPRTPGANLANVNGMIPRTPGGPAGAGVLIPRTPGAGRVPMTPGFQPMTPAVGFNVPMTPRPSAVQGSRIPMTPRASDVSRAPHTPAGGAMPFTPRGPSPFTPAGFAVPATPGGGLAMPFTPRGPPPMTPGGPNVAPYTPRGPPPMTPGGVQPFTPGAASPATPGVQPFTPGLAAPGTARGVPGTPGFIPFSGGNVAPQTPGFAGPGPGTPGFVTSSALNVAPQTPGMMPARGPGTPGFIATPSGNCAPMTPGLPRLMTKSPDPNAGEPAVSPAFKPLQPPGDAPDVPAGDLLPGGIPQVAGSDHDVAAPVPAATRPPHIASDHEEVPSAALPAHTTSPREEVPSPATKADGDRDVLAAHPPAHTTSDHEEVSAAIHPAHSSASEREEGAVTQPAHTTSDQDEVLAAIHPVHMTSDQEDGCVTVHPAHMTSDQEDGVTAMHPGHSTSDREEIAATHPVHMTSDQEDVAAIYPAHMTSDHEDATVAVHPMHMTSDHEDMTVAIHPAHMTSDHEDGGVAIHPAHMTSDQEDFAVPIHPVHMTSDHEDGGIAIHQAHMTSDHEDVTVATHPVHMTSDHEDGGIVVHPAHMTSDHEDGGAPNASAHTSASDQEDMLVNRPVQERSMGPPEKVVRDTVPDSATQPELPVGTLQSDGSVTPVLEQGAAASTEGVPTGSANPTEAGSAPSSAGSRDRRPTDAGINLSRSPSAKRRRVLNETSSELPGASSTRLSDGVDDPMQDTFQDTVTETLLDTFVVGETLVMETALESIGDTVPVNVDMANAETLEVAGSETGNKAMAVDSETAANDAQDEPDMALASAGA